MPTGLGEELKSLNYGEDLANALANIGKQVREGRLEAEAKKTLADMAGVDLSTDEGMKKFRSSILSLSQMEEPGQRGIKALNDAYVQPTLIQQQLETAKLGNLSKVKEEYEKSLSDYHQDLRTPNFNPDSAKDRYNLLMAQYNSLLPQFKGHENMLTKPEQPSAYRVASAPPKPFSDKDGHLWTWELGQDGKWAPAPLKDENGVWLEGKPSGTGAASPSTWEGNWDLTKGFTGDWNQTFLDSLPIQTRGIVSSLASYKMKIQDLTSMMRGAEREKLLAQASAVNPHFDATKYEARQAAVKDFSTGKNSSVVVSLNQAVGHLGELWDAANELNNADPKLWNMIRNSSLRNMAGDPRVDKFRRAALLVNEELAKAFGGKPGTVPELSELGSTLDSNASHRSMASVIAESVRLLKTRFKAEGQLWMSDTGLPINQMQVLDPNTRETQLSLLYPESRMALSKMGMSDLIHEILNPAAKSESTSEIKDKSGNDLEVGAVYRDKNGNAKRYMGNGKWQEIPHQ